jgi:PST family polysaccharide transporter
MAKKTISRNGIWLVLEKAVRSIMTLMVGAWVVRYLGPDQYGQLSYVIIFISFFQALSSLGIDGILIREIIFIQEYDQTQHVGKKKYIGIDNVITKEFSKKTVEDQLSTLITSVFLARAIAGVILLLTSLLLIGALKNWDSNYIFLTLFIGGGLIFQAADTFDLWNQSQLNSKLTVMAKLIAYVLSNGLRVFLIEIDASLIWFGFAFFVEAFVIATVLYLTYQRNKSWKFDLKELVNGPLNLIRETWPLITSSLLAAIYTRFDQIALEQYLGERLLGIYSGVIIFATATYFLPGIICTSVMPVLSKAKKRSQREYIKILRLTYILLLLISMIIAVITYQISELLLSNLYGDRFYEGIDILKIYALTNIPVYLGVAHGLWMINDKKLKISMYRSILGAATSILLCIFLVPQYGMSAAAYSTIAALLVSDVIVPALLNPTLFKEILGINIRWKSK